MAKKKLYTYINFADEVVALINHMENALEGEEMMFSAFADIIGQELDIPAMLQKAKDLKATHEKKAEYSKSKAGDKKSNVSPETLRKAEKFKSVLNAEPKTSAEIGEILGEEIAPLELANALKFAEGVEKIKVIREIVDNKGLKAQRQYTAYFVKE